MMEMNTKMRGNSQLGSIKTKCNLESIKNKHQNKSQNQILKTSCI